MFYRLAEQRRKRVKELEEKITDLNKKILDQDRVLKMKERNEEKIKSLNKEIMVTSFKCIDLLSNMYQLAMCPALILPHGTHENMLVCQCSTANTALPSASPTSTLLVSVGLCNLYA